jgi:ubiquinone/menaquinone biosynthesis C-methylase UbiE
MSTHQDAIRDQQRATWDRFAAGWKAWDGAVGGWLAPVSQAMIRQAKVRDHADVLDVATGTGEPGLTVAALIPAGRVTLTDLADRMLAVAADNAAHRGLRNVETRVCDAGTLPFADATFDTILCRFGFMFFPDLAAAATDLARVARPGARIVAAVWGRPDKNAWATTILRTIADHVVTVTAAPDAPGLFRCATPGSLRDVLSRAGFHDISEEDVSFDLILDTPADYWDFMNDVAAPVVSGLALADEATREKIRAEVLRLARQHLQDGRVHLSSTATIIAGTR